MFFKLHSKQSIKQDSKEGEKTKKDKRPMLTIQRKNIKIR